MSETGGRIVFPPFTLDLDAERLWRDDEAVDLRPKAWQLLRFFAERPGRLITKDELMDTVWADVTVTIASLNQTVVELRQALGDSARDPRFIETVHRRGYRFIAELGEGRGPGLPAADPSVLAPTVRPMVGRDGDLARLADAFRDARSGRRQVVFVTGEPGIGKTSVLRAFIDGLVAGSDGKQVFLGGAQCLDLLGECEAYLPVLETLERLTREERGESLRRALKRFAPTWLVQLPWLLDEGDASAASLAGTPARMLREFCVVVEAMAAERPIVVWIEDLHWCDPATVDLMGALARRTEPARLLLLGTYRPVDAAVRDHPIADLKKTLMAEGRCREVALELLSQTEVETWVTDRFGSSDDMEELARLIHDHTDGNPLFVETMIRTVDEREWVTRGEDGWTLTVPLDVVDAGLPDSLQEIVETELSSLGEREIEALQAASVAGESFAAQAVAAALAIPVEDSEAECDRLAGWRRVVASTGPTRWVDGVEGRGYEFLHDVFRQVIYDRLSPVVRRRLHRRLAVGLEAVSADHETGGAAEIALHFERGGEPDRAIDYLVTAARGVVRRFADREAVSFLERALELLASTPESRERDQRECDLRRFLARAHVLSIGYTAPEVTVNTDRLIEVGAAIDDVEAQLVGLSYRQDAHLATGDLDGARRWSDRTSRAATRATNPIHKGHAFDCAAHVVGLRGENRRSAELCERSCDLLRDFRPDEVSAVAVYDLYVTASAFCGWTEWIMGRPETARRLVREGLERLEQPGTTAISAAMAWSFSVAVERFCRDRDAVRMMVRELNDCLEESGIPWPYLLPAAAEGWLRVMDGHAADGVEGMTTASALAREVGANHCTSLLYATIADAELTRRQSSAGLEALDEAMRFVDSSGERFWEAEIHRLRGELLRLDDRDDEAERWFDRSLEVARPQEALALELRTTTSLAKLWRETGRADDARELLERVMGRFTEGFDTADFLEAKELLGSL